MNDALNRLELLVQSLEVAREALGIITASGRDPQSVPLAHPEGGTGSLPRAHLAPGRTHKASSAESILRHVLRRRGWSAEYRRGELSGEQHLALLEEVREYARGWLRHEAEVLFRVHGKEVGRALGEALAHHVGRFFSRARQFVREAIVAAAMAFGGPEPLTAADLAEADRQAHVQAEYLDRFEQDAHFRTPPDIALPEVPAFEPMSAPQFVARAEQYGNSTYTAAQAITRNQAIRMGALKERRKHVGGDIPCEMCIDQGGLEETWHPVGSRLPIGQCTCRQACHCHFEYLMPDGSIFVTTGGRKR